MLAKEGFIRIREMGMGEWIGKSPAAGKAKEVARPKGVVIRRRLRDLGRWRHGDLR